MFMVDRLAKIAGFKNGMYVLMISDNSSPHPNKSHLQAIPIFPDQNPEQHVAFVRYWKIKDK